MTARFLALVENLKVSLDPSLWTLCWSISKFFQLSLIMCPDFDHIFPFPFCTGSSGSWLKWSGHLHHPGRCSWALMAASSLASIPVLLGPLTYSNTDIKQRVAEEGASTQRHNKEWGEIQAPAPLGHGSSRSQLPCLFLGRTQLSPQRTSQACFRTNFALMSCCGILSGDWGFIYCSKFWAISEKLWLMMTGEFQEASNNL